MVGAILSGYAGYLLNAAYTPGSDINVFMEGLDKVGKAPFAFYWDGTSLKMIAGALFVYGIAILMYITSQKNYMPGREYGSSVFANIKMVNKTLADKEAGNNRMLSQNVRLSLDTRYTGLNNNILVIGGSGAGKTFYFVKPNLMQLNTSFICTDPKSELLNTCGDFLQKHGYRIKVVNLIDMEKSDCYNPFSYIRQESDVIRLVSNLIINTTPKNSSSSDPFWEKAESMYLQALVYYVWLECTPEKRNFTMLLELLNEAEVKKDGSPSELDRRMERLERKKGKDHPALKQYYKVIRGAGDTVRSIIISANSRLAFLENPQILRILSRDDLNIEEIGVGYNGDGYTKTCLFCVIPDNNKDYNFIIGMLYNQIFSELYYQADFNFGGRLPIHVTFMLDEFSNVALPDDYCSLLSTMRSREMSSIIIIQNMAQIKALFEKTWETVPGNCDTLIYLGGNESSTHEYTSKMAGKFTLDKKSSGETKGKNGSSSRNYDVLGRELLMPEEVRKLDNKQCLMFIRGLDPILDKKTNTKVLPLFKENGDGKGGVYVHQPTAKIEVKAFELLNDASFAYFKRRQDRGEPIFIQEITYEELMEIPDGVEVPERIFTEEEIQKNQKAELLNDRAKMKFEQRVDASEFTKQQLEEAAAGLEAGLSYQDILSYVAPENTGERMKRIRDALMEGDNV